MYSFIEFKKNHGDYTIVHHSYYRSELDDIKIMNGNRCIHSGAKFDYDWLLAIGYTLDDIIDCPINRISRKMFNESTAVK